MEKQFHKVYQRILSVMIVGIVIIICAACGKKKDGQKMEILVIGVEYINKNCDSIMRNFHSHISELRALQEESKESESVRASQEESKESEWVWGSHEESKEGEWDVKFETVRTEYIYDEQQNKIKIIYPQFNGFENLAKEERINALIEEDAGKIIGERNKEGDDTIYCVELKYKIVFLNERIVSILYEGWRGYIMPGDVSLKDEIIATTIDIEEEKVITLHDIVTDFAELSNMLLADEFESITMWEGVRGGYQFSEEFRGTADELEERLQGKQQEWYTDGENFIVIDKEHKYYNEYSISNESVKHILDADFLGKLVEDIMIERP